MSVSRYIVIILVFVMVALSGVSAVAQSTRCPNGPCPTNQSGSASDRLTDLTRDAARVVPTFIQAVEDPLGDFFNNLAYLLAYIVAFIFIIRLVWQSGETDDLYRSMVRMALMFALLGFVAYRSQTSGEGTDLVTFVSRIGNGIAYGGAGDDASRLGRAVSQRQTLFSNGYSDFVDNTFKYRINGQDRLIAYPDDPATGDQVFTVPNSGGDALVRVASAIQSDRGWNMDRLFQFLNISRGVVEFGDLFLLILQGFLITAVKMAAPFVVAISIDREFAQRVGKNFAWGAFVVLVIMPVISQIVRWFAYTAGAYPFGKIANPYFVYDATSGSVVVHGNPEYMIIISGVVMMICGLCLFASPFISYKLAQGGVFEAIAGTVSGWMGAMIGTGISMWSSATGAAISRQAAETTATANASAEGAQSSGSYSSSLIQANARHDATVQQSETEMMSAIRGANLESQVAGARADIGAQEKVAGYGASLSESLINNESKRRAEGFGAQVGFDKAAFEKYGVFGSIAQEAADILSKGGPWTPAAAKALESAGVPKEKIAGIKGMYEKLYGEKQADPGASAFTPQLTDGSDRGRAAGALTGSLINQAVKGAGYNPNFSSCGWTSTKALKTLGLLPPGMHNPASPRQTMRDLANAGWQSVDPSQMQAGDAVFFVGQNWGKTKFPDLGGKGFHQMTATGRGTVSGSPGHGLKFEENAFHMQKARGGEMFVMRSPKLMGSATADGGRSVLIPQGDQSIRRLAFPYQDKLLPFEKTRIETGGGDAAARYGYSIRTDAAFTEAAGLRRVAAAEASGKVSIAQAANVGRTRAADIDLQGTRESAKVQFEAAQEAIRRRYEGAIKAANEQRMATIVSSFGSTIASQLQGAMQQYNRF